MKTIYLVNYIIYDTNRSKILEKKDYLMGICMCPSSDKNEYWSFRLWPKTHKFQFLVNDGPLLHAHETMELLEGRRAFGHIVVKEVVYEND
jgi:hypothetical protein